MYIYTYIYIYVYIYNNFHVLPNNIFICNCSHCPCHVFVTNSCSLYTHVMLILIIISVQYLQNVFFKF